LIITGVPAEGTIRRGSASIAVFLLGFCFFGGGDGGDGVFDGGDGVFDDEEVLGFCCVGDEGTSVVMGIEPTMNVACGDFGEDEGDDCCEAILV
jgi:hypothetical protein